MTWKNGRREETAVKTSTFILMSPAVSTYFLFSNTPPHALVVKFVVSAKSVAKINQIVTQYQWMIPTRFVQQKRSPWKLINFTNFPADDSLHKCLQTALFLPQFIALRFRKSVDDNAVRCGRVVFVVRFPHFKIFWVNYKIRFSTQKERKESRVIMFLCHFNKRECFETKSFRRYTLMNHHFNRKYKQDFV